MSPSIGDDEHNVPNPISNKSKILKMLLIFGIRIKQVNNHDGRIVSCAIAQQIVFR